MPVILQEFIERDDLRAHPEWLYVFGDNEARRGLRGQAAACRSEPNAVGVATKRFPRNHPNAYWSDDEYDRVVAIVDADLAPAFEHVRRGGVVVLPTAGLGTGLSELPTRAPRVFAFLEARLAELKRIGGVD